MPRKTQTANRSQTRRARNTRRKPAQQPAKAKRDATGTEPEKYSIQIIQALIYAKSFSEESAVTVDNLHDITGITVEEIQFLACQLAAPGFAVLEGPAPAISETEIKHLYIETDPNKLLAFTLGLAQNGLWAHGRAECYAKQYEAMLSAKHPWSSGGLPAVPRLSGTSAAMGT